MNIKEKWEMVKTKACETKEKVKNWYAENKEIVNVTALVAGVYGGLLAWAAIAGKKLKSMRHLPLDLILMTEFKTMA